ncbi:MAG: cbb3-type cytochrome oxidase assembly protein CcoS [Gemmobacter sp.]|nr:cbb3-type cytochrome oxidase assembly protein CcoS [Gemmobacter sp.]
MNYFFLIPISITLGLTGLGAFFWCMRNNQYDDLDGAATRILIPDTGPPVSSNVRGLPQEDRTDHAASDR